MSLEPFLANKTAEMVGFTLISNFEFSSILVKNHAANWISKRHYFFLSLMQSFYFLPFMVNGRISLKQPLF
jgi:hypothetical protein